MKFPKLLTLKLTNADLANYSTLSTEFSWLPAMELEHANELISNFHSAYLQKPSPISKL